MITDQGLRLATAEATPHAGAGGISGASAALALDPGGITEMFRNFNDIGAGRVLMLNFNVDVSFTATNVVFPETMEFQLISLPVPGGDATLSPGTTSGKQMLKLLVPADIADADPDLADTFNIVGHGLPLGAPFFITTIAGTLAGVVEDVIYYAVPTTADHFQAATSLANALAGTTIDLITSDDTVTINYIPTIHASSGGMQMFDDPSDLSPLQAETQFQVPVRPLVGPSTKLLLPTSQATTPVEGELEQPVGAGPGANLIGGNSQRFYYLRYVPSATITAGAITCDLVIEAGDALKFYGSGFKVI